MPVRKDICIDGREQWVTWQITTRDPRTHVALRKLRHGMRAPRRREETAIAKEQNRVAAAAAAPLPPLPSPAIPGPGAPILPSPVPTALFAHAPGPIVPGALAASPAPVHPGGAPVASTAEAEADDGDGDLEEDQDAEDTGEQPDDPAEDEAEGESQRSARGAQSRILEPLITWSQKRMKKRAVFASTHLLTSARWEVVWEVPGEPLGAGGQGVAHLYLRVRKAEQSIG